jgi:hypothetical protein
VAQFLAQSIIVKAGGMPPWTYDDAMKFLEDITNTPTEKEVPLLAIIAALITVAVKHPSLGEYMIALKTALDTD